MTVASFVENDAQLNGGSGGQDAHSPTGSCRSSSTEPGRDQVDGPTMLILTGPNYSGKSVYMKMVRFSYPLATSLVLQASGCTYRVHGTCGKVSILYTLIFLI